MLFVCFQLEHSPSVRSQMWTRIGQQSILASFCLFVFFQIAAYTIRSVSKFEPALCEPELVSKVKEHIYVLCFDTSRPATIRAYDDSSPHDLLLITVLEGFGTAFDMVSIENTNTLYVSDWKNECIWKIDPERNKVSKWLSKVGFGTSFSAANDNHLLVLRSLRDRLYFVIYNQDAKFVRSRSVLLPRDFRYPFNVVQKPNGEFIVSHSINSSPSKIVSFLSTDGKIISQHTLEEENRYAKVQLFLDTESNNLIAAELDYGNIYLLDQKTLNWNRIYRSSESYVFGGLHGWHYDAKKTQLVRVLNSTVEIFSLNKNQPREKDLNVKD